MDADVADAWGALLARTAGDGVSMSVADAILAATALVHGLTLATRNVKDFAHAGVAAREPLGNVIRKWASEGVDEGM